MALKEVQIRDAKEGAVVLRYGKITRTNELIMAFSWDKAQAKGSRNYYHKGKEVVCEGDQDGDGCFEMLILFDDEHTPIEVFERSTEGLVLPVSRKRLEEIRKDYDVANKVITPVVESIREQRGLFPKKP